MSQEHNNRKDLTQAQQKALRGLVAARQLAEQKIQEFLAYLYDEHGLDESWKVNADLKSIVRQEVSD